MKRGTLSLGGAIILINVKTTRIPFGIAFFLVGLFLSSCTTKPKAPKTCDFFDEMGDRPFIYKGPDLKDTDAKGHTYVGYQYLDSGRIRQKFSDKNCNLRFDIGIVSDSSPQWDGLFKEYYPTGELTYWGVFQRGKKIGIHNRYGKDGGTLYEYSPGADSLFGYEKFFNKKSELVAEGEVFRGRRAGTWKIRRRNGFRSFKWEDVFYDSWELSAKPQYNSNLFLKENFNIEWCHESQDFVYFCTPQDKDAAIFSDQVLAKAYPILVDSLKFKPKRKIQIILFSRRIEFRRFGVNIEFGFIGQCLNQGKIIVLSNKNATINKMHYKKTLAHELVHAFIEGINNDSVVLPRWLHEGAAEYFSNSTRRSIAKIKRDVKSSEIRTMNELELSFYNSATINLAYSTSFYVVRYLIREYGIEKMNQFIRSPDNFEAHYGFPIADLWFSFKENLMNEKMSVLEILRN
jgi:hypothetical protein